MRSRVAGVGSRGSGVGETQGTDSDSRPPTPDSRLPASSDRDGAPMLLDQEICIKYMFKEEELGE
jgi:hypothetical protein